MVPEAPPPLCVTIPGGVTVCATSGVETGDIATISKGALAQLGPALAPMMPIFDVVGALKDAANCIAAIPDPVEIAKALIELKKKIDRLIGLLPQFSVPKLAKGMLDVIVATLRGLRARLRAMLRQQERILAAQTKASNSPASIGAALAEVLGCATENLNKQLGNEQASLGPLNDLLGLLNTLLGLAGLPTLPTFDNLGALSEAMLTPLDTFIDVLSTFANAIPL